MKYNFWERYKINDFIWIKWDTFLGLPFNIASYAILLEIIANEVNMIPEELIGSLGDTHLYSNHIEAATEQIGELSVEDRIVMANNSSINYAHKMKDYIYRDLLLAENNIPIRTRVPYKLPKLVFDRNISIFNLNRDMFKIEDYWCHSEIKAPLSN